MSWQKIDEKTNIMASRSAAPPGADDSFSGWSLSRTSRLNPFGLIDLPGVYLTTLLFLFLFRNTVVVAS